MPLPMQLPAYEYPRNALVDFKPINDAIDANRDYSVKQEGNALKREHLALEKKNSERSWAQLERQRQADEVKRADLPFEFMLNALRLRAGFELGQFTERTGLPVNAIAQALAQAEARGLIERDGAQMRPTERGFDFLSELQALFLA